MLDGHCKFDLKIRVIGLLLTGLRIWLGVEITLPKSGKTRKVDMSLQLTQTLKDWLVRERNIKNADYCWWS